MQHERALQSNELIDFNFRAVLSLPDVFKLSSFAGHKLVTLSLVFFVLFFSVCLGSEAGCYLRNAVFKCVKSFCG